MEMKFYDYLDANPVIAAVKDMDGVKKCCEREEIKIVFILFGDVCSICRIVEEVKKCCEREEIKIVFILFGDVCSICRIVEELKAHGKVAMVHMDLVSGLSGKEVAVDFIKKNTRADGIISTKPALIKRGPGSWISIRPSGCSSWIPWPLKILKSRWDLQGPTASRSFRG